jgi:hypothetical protein
MGDGKDLNGNGTIEAMQIDQNGVITPGDHAGIPFGIANEHMDAYYNQEGRDSIFVRHEDHVGHKIEIVNYESEMVGNTTHPMAQLAGTNGINIPYYKSGSETYQPTLTSSHCEPLTVPALKAAFLGYQSMRVPAPEVVKLVPAP